jgi:hypothetical protein
MARLGQICTLRSKSHDLATASPSYCALTALIPQAHPHASSPTSKLTHVQAQASINCFKLRGTSETERPWQQTRKQTNLIPRDDKNVRRFSLSFSNSNSGRWNPTTRSPVKVRAVDNRLKQICIASIDGTSAQVERSQVNGTSTQVQRSQVNGTSTQVERSQVNGTSTQVERSPTWNVNPGGAVAHMERSHRCNLRTDATMHRWNVSPGGMAFLRHVTHKSKKQARTGRRLHSTPEVVGKTVSARRNTVQGLTRINAGLTTTSCGAMKRSFQRVQHRRQGARTTPRRIVART